MAEQLALIAPGSGGKEMPVQARVLARANDAETSKEAARRKVQSGGLNRSQLWALTVVTEYVEVHGPSTPREMTYSDRTYYELCRRLPELERKGQVRVQQDPSKPCRCKPNAKRCRCRDVTRNNSRVWGVT